MARSVAQVLGLAVACLLALALATPREAGAAPAAPSASAKPSAATLVLSATPLLGETTPSVYGWFSIAVDVENTSDSPVEGNLIVEAKLPYGSKYIVKTRAPFAVPARGRAMVELPTHGFRNKVPSVRVVARTTAGAEIAATPWMSTPQPDPVLLDLNVPSRIGPAVRSQGLVISYKPYSRSSFAQAQVNVAIPRQSKGELVLPTRSAGYASTTVVMAKSETIASLRGDRLDALAGWLLAGGSLAVIVSRPEDLRSGVLTTLVGSTVREATVQPWLKQRATFLAPAKRKSSSSYSTPTPRRVTSAPSPQVAALLKSYAGGNLKASPWGASASYGLGEVHLLAYDASKAPFVDDEWVGLKTGDLVRHAWDRNAQLVYPHGSRAPDDRVKAIRRQLDPNESARWSVVIAALLLIIYSVVAGPLNFYTASKAGKPLRALRHLPIYAGITLLIIVVMGVLSKGLRGRARHLTVVEAGAGMTRATAARYRGFYASSSDELIVRATDYNSLLDVAGDGEDHDHTIVVDRDGARLEEFRAKPWQTVIVREDGFIDLGGGVSLVKNPAGDVEVKNRLARDLIGVIVKVPGAPATLFKRIADGKSVAAKSGTPLNAAIGKHLKYGPTGRRRLNSGLFMKELEGISDGLGDAWKAVDVTAGSRTDWWPTDVPVLIAQVDGGEGKDTDSGMTLEEDRVLIRVIGYGGVL